MKKLFWVVVLSLVAAAHVYAQVPNPVNATDRLRFESLRLDQAVTVSQLGPQVRNATYNLALQSDLLYRCVIGSGRKPQPGRPISTTLCNQEALRTQNFFRIVDQFLWNTQGSAPQVHYQFLRTSQAHQQAQVAVNSGSQSGLLRASGYMNRIQFHFQGRGPAALINQCLNWGQAYGIMQVYELYVNGRIVPLGGIANIRQGCQLVANYAIPVFKPE